MEPDKCLVCTKTVYPTEKINTDGRIYHKACFRCQKCNSVLKLGSYASMQGEVFCKPCFKKNFFSKGNYSEGFGKLKPQQEFEAKAGKSTTPVTSPPAVTSPPVTSPPAQSSPAEAPRALKSSTDSETKPALPTGGPPSISERTASLNTSTTPPPIVKSAPSPAAKSAASPAAKSASPAAATGGSNKCQVCTKTVYKMEELVADGKTYHKACFRCSVCNGQLKLGNYASMEGVFFCKPCFKKNFLSKGNYSEGFGKLKPQQEFEAKSGKRDEEASSPRNNEDSEDRAREEQAKKEEERKKEEEKKKKAEEERKKRVEERTRKEEEDKREEEEKAKKEEARQKALADAKSKREEAAKKRDEDKALEEDKKQKDEAKAAAEAKAKALKKKQEDDAKKKREEDAKAQEDKEKEEKRAAALKTSKPSPTPPARNPNQDELVRLRSEVSKLNDDNGDLRKKVESLTAELQAAKEAQQTAPPASDNNAELESLRQALDQEKTSNANLASKLKSVESELKALSEELEDEKGMTSSLIKKQTSMEVEAEKHAREAASLRTENQRLQTELAAQADKQNHAPESETKPVPQSDDKEVSSEDEKEEAAPEAESKKEEEPAKEATPEPSSSEDEKEEAAPEAESKEAAVTQTSDKKKGLFDDLEDEEDDWTPKK